LDCLQSEQPQRRDKLGTFDLIQYTVPVQIGEISVDGTFAFVLQAHQDNQNSPQEFSEVTNSLSFVFGILINELMELNLPHNLLITDDGRTIFVFVRDFGSKDNLYGWLEFSGAVPVKD
jgi:hypothetical protein